MRTRMLTVALLCLIPCLAGVSAPRAEVEPPLVTVTPYAGTTVLAEEIGLEDGLLYGGRLGFMFSNRFGLEATYGLADLETDFGGGFATDLEHVGLDAMFRLLPPGRLVPYLTAGWGQLTYDSTADNDPFGGRDHVFNGWELGGGLLLRLAEGEQTRASLRLDVRDVISNLTPAFNPGGDAQHSLLVTAGLGFAFGRSGRDSDGDGIRDRHDLCPDTPRGAWIDGDGCPRDGDGDGVPDGLDRCDGTPAGAVVDAAGCPRDGDGDGVLDGLDRCAGTPAGAEIDAVGCPRDSDGDGVLDGLDDCPGTPAHLKVDAKGCPVEITETEIQLLDTGMISTSAVRFDSGTAELKPASRPVLDEIGQTLAHWPDLRIEIGGHTDAQGSAESNQRLSEARAQAVLDYLLARVPEIRPAQFSVRGYGESRPVADNATAEGRAANRRVEFRVLNTEELKRTIETQKLLER